jgi:hypothetical protein
MLKKPNGKSGFHKWQNPNGENESESLTQIGIDRVGK